MVPFATFTHLASQCQRHQSWYQAAVHHDPVLALYEAPADVVTALCRSSTLPARDQNALVFALVRAHHAVPHPVWLGILLLSFERMLRRLRDGARGASGRELEQQIVLCFVEAVTRCGAYCSADRIAMHLRQLTQRALYRHLRDEARYAQVPLGPTAAPAAPIVARCELRQALDVPADPLLKRATLESADRGELRALVRRQHPGVSVPDMERIYRRLQRRRHRLLGALRTRASAPRPMPPAPAAEGRLA